ncbi:MAG: COX15/CtaA family protein [Lentisphaeraceae bacterium]|nr:COX15/CtaA family protein [Lentisphaeraceae bacterium]
MNSQDAQFHGIVLGVILLLVVFISVMYSKQKPELKEKLFHGLYGLLSIGTLILIFVGAMVASTRSGMAFMDWPTSNGLIWPGLDQWMHQKDMFWEHFHRLIAEGVGVVAICALIWSFFVFDKKYVKASAILLILIIVQGIFGGLTVKKITAWWTSTLHGVVAQLVFCYMVVVFYKTSKKIRSLKKVVDDDSWLRSIPKIVCVIVLIQLLLGASFRHKMKVAQFSTTLDESTQIFLKKKNLKLIPSKSGDYTVQLKVGAAGDYGLSLSDTLEISKTIAQGSLEFVNAGVLNLTAGKEYELSTIGNILDIKITGPERIQKSSFSDDKDKYLPFVIVYKEKLDGNRHLLWAHIGFAIVVTVFVIFLGMYLFKKKEKAPFLKGVSLGLLITVVIQIFLGLIALITVNERQKDIYDQVKTILTSAHLANGAVLLSFCVLALFLCRWGFVKSAIEE